MRRSLDGFGGEPCTRRTWCSDISPGASTTSAAREPFGPTHEFFVSGYLSV